MHNNKKKEFGNDKGVREQNIKKFFSPFSQFTLAPVRRPECTSQPPYLQGMQSKPSSGYLIYTIFFSYTYILMIMIRFNL
jgi:hypothetical protein